MPRPWPWIKSGSKGGKTEGCVLLETGHGSSPYPFLLVGLQDIESG